MQSRDEFVGMIVRGCVQMYQHLTERRVPGTDSAHSSKSNCYQRVTLHVCKEIQLRFSLISSILG